LFFWRRAASRVAFIFETSLALIDSEASPCESGRETREREREKGQEKKGLIRN